MILTVDICRETDLETSRSRLRAYVVQEIEDRDGRTREIRGSDLLVRRYTNVDSALRRCHAALLDTYKLLELPPIKYRFTDDALGSSSPAAAPAINPEPPAMPTPAPPEPDSGDEFAGLPA